MPNQYEHAKIDNEFESDWIRREKWKSLEKQCAMKCFNRWYLLMKTMAHQVIWNHCDNFGCEDEENLTIDTIDVTRRK